jgi:hypothetical protein
MPVIIPDLAPRGAGRFFAAVFAPLDVRALAEHVGNHERADVQAHAVVQVRVPADGLLLQRLPADENVVGGLAFEDELELFLELLGLQQAVVSPGLLVGHGFLLSLDPIAEVGVNQFLQQLVVELVVVDQGAETVLPAIPNLPDERAVMEQLAVLLEEPVAEPVLQ